MVRLTVAEAALKLGISEAGVRKRVQRNQITHERGHDGRLRVWVSPDETRHAESRDTSEKSRDVLPQSESSALISEMRTRIQFLEDELQRKDAILLNMTEAMKAISPPSQKAPSEPRETPQTIDEGPERAEPHSATGEAQESAASPHQRSAWLAPVEKQPWWQYAVGILVVSLAPFVAFTGRPLSHSVNLLILLGIWSIPGIFGFWRGFRQRNLPPWLQITLEGVLVAVAAALGYCSGWIVFEFGGQLNFRRLWDLREFILSVLVPAGLLYVSGALVGNAWQRRRVGRITGTTPPPPVSRTRPSAGQQPRKDLTPAQQALLGWSGAIISALISLVGTIITVRSGR
jgi:hypothetical protein